MLTRKPLALLTSALLGTTLLVSLPTAAETASTFPLPQAPAAAPLTATAVSTPAPAPAAGSLPELTTLIKQNSPAVVSIRVEGRAKRKVMNNLPPELERFFRGMPGLEDDEGDAPGFRTQAGGSGFIISADGYVVTNAHVVEDAKSVMVGLSDRRELPADIVGVDTLSDIALLKVKADGLPSVQLGDSDSLQVGQWVVAIGAPFGLDFTATQGIVSALSRSLPDGTYVPFIQTDVAVNPGNSGGPLFDLGGRVVGVNSQIYSRSGGYMGISFAIPANVVKTVVEQLKTSGKVERGWLGVGIQDVSPDLAQSFNLSQLSGALVGSVMQGSPAEKAGIQVGDIIIGFGSGVVKSSSDLPLLVGNTPVGSEVTVKLLRQGAEKTVNVTIAKLNGKDDAQPQVSAVPADQGSLGILVSALTADELQQRKINNGVLIDEVQRGSVAERAGLSQGDVVVSVNNQPVTNPADLKTAVQAAPSGKPLALLIQKGEQTRFVAVTKP